MKSFFKILIILCLVGGISVGICNWYYHNVMIAPPELTSFEFPNDAIKKSEWLGVVYVFGLMPDLFHGRIVNLMSPIPSINELSDEQVINNSKTIPEVQAFLTKYPDATNYVDRSGSFLLKYIYAKQYEPDYWNYDDHLSLRLLMYADGTPYKIIISCQQDVRKETSKVLEYLEIETCLREPIPTKEKSELMPLCNSPLSIIPLSWESTDKEPSLMEWEETGRYYMHQRFADELYHKDIRVESDCMDVKTGVSEIPSISYFKMCSVVDVADDNKYYLEGSINGFDVGYFYMSDQMHYPCNEDHLECLCQFNESTKNTER